MTKKNTYTYEMDGIIEGPYLFEQIVGMAESGIIRADVQVKCIETEEDLLLIDFFRTITEDGSDVIIKDVEMKFASMVEFMIKWVIASIPAAIILFILFAIFQAFLLSIGTTF